MTSPVAYEVRGPKYLKKGIQTPVAINLLGLLGGT
jgi:hypothetical protein